MESKKQYTNIAFISYKREDERWAKWLQKKLEHYKLPIDIREQNPDLEFLKNPRHVFKDTTDLSGGVLEKAIKEGLSSSKYLIVICSPLAAKSPWVCKEVQEFIDSGREEYIIPFIIDGEPYSKDSAKECFPEALRSLTGERELLGININENGRDSAAVKVIARMFDLRFDTLWNRFQREEIKKRRFIRCSSFIAILFLLGVIAGGAYGYRQIQKNQALAVAEKAMQKISEGFTYEAMLALLEVLPENKQMSWRIYVPEAELALRTALDSLTTNTYIKHTLSDDRFCDYSRSGKYIISHTDYWGTDSLELSIIDSPTFQELWTLTISQDYSYIGFSQDDNFFEIGIGDQLFLYYAENGEPYKTTKVVDTDFSKVIQQSYPLYIDSYLQSDEEYKPNIFTKWFNPTRKKLQVIDYLPLRKILLYKTIDQLSDNYCDVLETYRLINLENDSTLWDFSDRVTYPSDINGVSVSHNGKYLVVSRWSNVDIFDLRTKYKHSIKTYDDHYTNIAYLSSDGNALFQTCQLGDYSYFYDLGANTYTDSIKNYPMFPTSVSFSPNSNDYIVNYFDWITTEHKSCMYTHHNYLQDTSYIHLDDLVNGNQTRFFSVDQKHTRLIYNKRGTKWSTPNATLLGFTSDLQYVVVEKTGYRGTVEYQVLDVNSGLCMKTQFDKSDERIHFLPYDELLKKCKSLTKGYKLTPKSQKEFYL